MIESKRLLHTGLVGALIVIGLVGCASGDDGTAQQDGTLTGDGISPACPSQPPPPPSGGGAKGYSGRAVSVSVYADLQKRSTTSWDGIVVIGDTKAIGPAGGSLTKSLLTVEAGPLVQAAVFNGVVKAGGGKSHAAASTANASVLASVHSGLLKDVLGEDGRGGTISINLRDILASLGITDAALDGIFNGGPLQGGIQADVLEETADAWCAGGKAVASADGTIARLVIGGHPIDITLGANVKVLSLPGLVEVTLNEQIVTGGGGAISVDASALHVNLLDGLIDVKVSRALAGVACGDSDGGGGGGGGGGGCGSK